MKFLCLPGTYGSAKNFQVQLGPFVTQAETANGVKFKFTQGDHEAIPPPGFEEYFGAGPLFRFMDVGLNKGTDMISKLRDFPVGATAEDTMRLLFDKDAKYVASNVMDAMDSLLAQVDADPEIDGILGYSEGATTAASLILEERRRCELYGRPRRIKRAIFFAGWPPLRIDEEEKIQPVLADECEDVVDVPSLHVVGCNDPYILGAMALFNICDEDTAELFDHGKGHTVPRDRHTINQLCSAIVRLGHRDEDAGAQVPLPRL